MRNAKRAPVGSKSKEQDHTEQLRKVKKEKVARADSVQCEPAPESQQEKAQRRVLRSKYVAVSNKISDHRDELQTADSDDFFSIMNEVESLHQHVQKPREQVVDAEALLGLANTLVASVKSHSSEDFTPSEFVTCLLNQFGQSTRRLSESEESVPGSCNWKDMGIIVSPVIRTCRGCCTMLGPMRTELKQRKTAVQRKRTRPTESARPEEVDDRDKEEKADTDRNMKTMFDILRSKTRVRLERLILNRKSFAQTVENLFALSFLAKDGRVEVLVDDKGSHFVAPTNAPDARTVMSGEVSYRHFVFRLDFTDWKLMMDMVPVGEELMPHRQPSGAPNTSQAGPAAYEPPEELATTPIRKLSRNRGLVIQEDAVVEDSPDIKSGITENGIGRRRRRLI